MRKKSDDKFILDVCCGAKQFWFDKQHPNTIYNDIRKQDYTLSGRQGQRLIVSPDTLYNFKKLEFKDNSFKLIVFDPPHITNCKEDSIMGIMYGSLTEFWKDDLRQGFSECFRVLDNYGILIFKWAESRIPIKDILKLTKYKPLFGHKTRRNGLTHWVCFMKI